MKELNIDNINNVSGGYIFRRTYRENTTGFEVIDDKTGNVVEYFARYDLWSAEACARKNGLSTEFISWDDLEKLRIKSKLGDLPEMPPQIAVPVGS